MIPSTCFSFNRVSGEYIAIKRGETGYYQTTIYTEDHCRALNVMAGVTEEQRLAMDNGSMFGWDAPAADPRHVMNTEQATANRASGKALAA